MIRTWRASAAGALVVVAGVTAVAASQTDHAGPILAFVAALLVAVMTAVTTNRRQAAQLAHARQLADLADLRTLLDEAAVALHRADYIRADVRLGLGLHQHELDKWVPEARDTLDERGRALDAMAARLGVRLDSDEPVVVAFRAAVEALLALGRRLSLVRAVPNDRRWDEDQQAIAAASDDFEQHVREFHQEAVERAGTAA